jgi:excisionase family DNA binding protein
VATDRTTIDELLRSTIREELTIVVREVLLELLSNPERLALSSAAGSKRTNAPPLYAMAYTVAEAAQLLRVGTTTMRNMIRRGEIAVVRDGGVLRISRSAIEDWIHAHEGKVEQSASDTGSARGAPYSSRIVEEVFGDLNRPKRRGRPPRK